MADAPKQTFHCGDPQGAEHGPVIGCCHVCGLLLCEQHVYHATRSRHFGSVGRRAAHPLLCGEHAKTLSGAQRGLPAAPSAAPPRRLFRRPTLPSPSRRRRG